MGLTTNVVRGANAERLLLLIHGLGADEKDLAGLLPYLDPDGRFVVVLPRGPYSAPPGYSWFQLGGPPELMMGTMQSSLDAVDEVLDEACLQYGMARRDAVVGGFSQGAALSLALGLMTSEKPRPAGILAMSGFLAPEGRFTYAWEAADLPAVLMQHGSQDPMIPVDRGRASAQALKDKGVAATFREYPMEHNVSMESVQDAKAWLDRVRAGERPSEDVSTAPPADDGPVKTVTSQTFDQEVLRSELPVIVDFWAPWCQPCRMVSPIVEQIAHMRQGRYKVVKLNIDQAPDIAQRYEVQSIPMIALFRNGRLERRSMGAKPRPQLEAELGMLVIP